MACISLQATSTDSFHALFSPERECRENGSIKITIEIFSFSFRMLWLCAESVAFMQMCVTMRACKHVRVCVCVFARVCVVVCVCLSVDHLTNHFLLIFKSDNHSFTWSWSGPHPIIWLQHMAFPLKVGQHKLLLTTPKSLLSLHQKSKTSSHM